MAFQARRCCCIDRRDRVIIGKIIDYCDRVQNNLERYEYDYGSFQRDLLFQDACCMCVVQIGELVSLLSEDIRRANPSVPWRVIKDTRNYYVHDYGSIDIAAVWDTLNHDLPELKTNCQRILSSE